MTYLNLYLYILKVMNRRILLETLLLLFFSFRLAQANNFEVLKSDLVSIHYKRGSRGAAEEVFRLLPDINSEIEMKLDMDIDFEFEIVLFRDRSNFLRLTDNNQYSAFAVPDTNLIFIDLSQMKVHPLNLRLIVIHELCHLTLHRYINEDNLPRWLDEGISQWVSGGTYELIDLINSDVLKKAYLSKTLLSFYDIGNRFPAERLILAYEQSRSLIEFLEKEYGKDKIKHILYNLKNGDSIENSLYNNLSLNMKELENRWRNSLKYKYTWLSYLANNIYWILFITCAFLTIYGFIRLRVRMKRYSDEDDDITFDIE